MVGNSRSSMALVDAVIWRFSLLVAVVGRAEEPLHIGIDNAGDLPVRHADQNSQCQHRGQNGRAVDQVFVSLANLPM